jgi:hypothetical protein
LPQPDDPHEAARRLFITDAFIKAGTTPFAILRALGFDETYLEAVEKLYNPLEPRVPAGNGILSGRWTAIGSFLAELTATQLARLGAWGLVQLGVAAGAVAVAGVLVFPSPNRIRVEGDIKGLPGGRYWWNRDEAQLQLTCETADGEQRTFTAWRHEDKVLTRMDVSLDACWRMTRSLSTRRQFHPTSSKATSRGSAQRLVPTSPAAKKEERTRIL